MSRLYYISERRQSCEQEDVTDTQPRILFVDDEGSVARTGT